MLALHSYVHSYSARLVKILATEFIDTIQGLIQGVDGVASHPPQMAIATTQTCKLNHYSYDMSIASIDLTIVQVASTVAEHLCSLIFSQNYFQIQSQKASNYFFWGHAPRP